MSNKDEEIDYDTIYADHIAKMNEKHDKKMSVPVQVKAKDPETFAESEKKEQEIIQKELDKVYCICNHKRNKHENETGQCKHQATQFFKNKLMTWQCECTQFVSRTDQQKEEIVY